MSKKKNKNLTFEEVNNFRELVEKRYKNFGDNVVFKYKKDGEVQEVTYSQYVEDIKALRNSYFKPRSK